MTEDDREQNGLPDRPSAGEQDRKPLPVPPDHEDVIPSPGDLGRDKDGFVWLFDNRIGHYPDDPGLTPEVMAEIYELAYRASHLIQLGVGVTREGLVDHWPHYRDRHRTDAWRDARTDERYWHPEGKAHQEYLERLAGDASSGTGSVRQQLEDTAAGLEDLKERLEAYSKATGWRPDRQEEPPEDAAIDGRRRQYGQELRREYLSITCERRLLERRLEELTGTEREDTGYEVIDLDAPDHGPGKPSDRGRAPDRGLDRDER